MLPLEYINALIGTEPGIYLITTYGHITLIDVRETPGGRRIEQFPLGCVVNLHDLHRLLDFLGELSPLATQTIAMLDYQAETLANMVRRICTIRHAGPDDARRAA